MVAPMCPRCAEVVALYEGRPAVTAAGHVELWHPACWEARALPLPAVVVAVVPPVEPARRRLGVRAWAAIGGAVVVAGALAAAIAGGAAEPDTAAPVLGVIGREPLAIRGAMAAREDAPPRAPRTFKPVDSGDEMPLVDGVPLDEVYPSLRGWVHPVTASSEYMPSSYPRLFGAERAGVFRAECGAGHCGVDLDGPRGRPIVAVSDGIAVRVERRELGGDGRSGRYVRIQHADGTFTSYMHMDEVADGVDVGTAVTRGQFLGTLGATAVYAAVPHLHFSLELPAPGHRESRGDHVATQYVNPAPFLMRSTIAPVGERPSRPALN